MFINTVIALILFIIIAILGLWIIDWESGAMNGTAEWPVLIFTILVVAFLLHVSIVFKPRKRPQYPDYVLDPSKTPDSWPAGCQPKK